MTCIRFRLLAVSLPLWVCLWIATPAQAIPLVSATHDESTSGTVGGPFLTDDGASDDPEAVSLALAGPGGSFHSVAWTSGGNLGTASAFVAASGTGANPALFGWGSANTLIFYQFAVEEIVPSCTIPPCPAIYVPVVIQANGAVSASGSGGVPDPFESLGYSAGAAAQIYFSANGAVPALLDSAIANSSQGTLADQFDFIDTFDVRVDWVHNVSLRAFAHVNKSVSNDPGEGTANAFIDPIIEIDPAYAASYRVVVSEGVSVPEPSSALLLAVGALGLASAMRCAGPVRPRASGTGL